MATTFAEQAIKFVGILDEVYQKEAVTSILETNGVDFSGTAKVKVPSIIIDGAADYDRQKGYTDGAIEVKYDDYELEFDRGRKFRIDTVDNDEVAFKLYRTAALEYVRTKEIPETDALRFSKIAAVAEKTEAGAITDALDMFDEAESYLTDAEVPEADRILFVSSAFYKALKKGIKDNGRFGFNDNNGAIKRKIQTLDDYPLIKVPKGRFYNVIQLRDGKTAGQEAGGYITIDGTSKSIHFIFAQKSALNAITKRKNDKIIIPELNQSADAYDVFYRHFHDLIVTKNKRKGIYIATE